MVILVGDTQRTGFWERLLLREQNDAGRSTLMEEIAREEPAMVVILGDLVENGGDLQAWSYFDSCSRPIRERRIPVVAVPGNHEYFGSGGEANFLQQFPRPGGRTWMAVRQDSVVFMLLNSNFGDMESAAVDSQDAWYRRSLEQCERDSSVAWVVVCCHHPPFTNSTIVSASAEVERRFVGPFLAARKAVLFFSGHCHSYEHFERQGKSFLVSGGGGGPRQRVVADPRRQRFPDLYQGPPLRPLHFCRLIIERGRLRVQMVGLAPSSSHFSVGDEVVIAHPGG
jgi:3',5'-cyclic AMP phosphodiesterase CpdA